MAILQNSARNLLKATHAPLRMENQPKRRAVEKIAFVGALKLQLGDVASLKSERRLDVQHINARGVLDRIAVFEPESVPTLMPLTETLADVPFEDLKRVGEILLDQRISALQVAKRSGSEGAIGEATQQVSAARTALAQFSRAFEISPVGLLYLERVEMVPAGIERGELIATIPLAPGEITSVSQKEWSVTSDEFSEIVTDYLESYSEKGSTEKTELATATESQNKHSQQLGLDSSISGSYGFVTFSAKTSFDMSSSNEESKKNSRTHAQDVTAKASARVRKERKVTIQTNSITGSENTTARVVSNPSSTESMRIDYYSMMRKWRVRLLQYGLRLTYDIAIPEPGATLRKQLVALADLEQRISESFVFNLKQSDITVDTYLDLAAQYGVRVSPPPTQAIFATVGGVLEGLVKNQTNWMFFEFPFVVPDGYKITQVSIDAMTNNTTLASGDGVGIRSLQVLGLQNPVLSDPPVDNPYIRRDLSGDPGFLVGKTGSQKITVYVNNLWKAAVTFPMKFEPTMESMSTWRSDAWEAIRNGARDAYYASQQSLVQQRDALLEQIGGVDTLTLRREERDEIMKGVLRWLLGPGFDFMPVGLDAALSGSNTAFTEDRLTWPNGAELDFDGWKAMFIYQETVKFIHQAIEWENLLCFPYPYFWDSAGSWETVRMMRHQDLTRQQFLRAGSARVVLTIRPGYEEAFSAFVDTRDFGSVLPSDHPYFSIGEELRAFSNTNFPGLPPANPETHYRPLITPLQRKAWDDMRKIITSLENHKKLNGVYPTTAQGLALLGNSLPMNDPWGQPYLYACPGAFNDYELSSLGHGVFPDDGLSPSGGEPLISADDAKIAPITSWATCNLIAEWHEYTPSHGTDIQINTAASDAG